MSKENDFSQCEYFCKNDPNCCGVIHTRKLDLPADTIVEINYLKGGRSETPAYLVLETLSVGGYWRTVIAIHPGILEVPKPPLTEESKRNLLALEPKTVFTQLNPNCPFLTRK